MQLTHFLSRQGQSGEETGGTEPERISKKDNSPQEVGHTSVHRAAPEEFSAPVLILSTAEEGKRTSVAMSSTNNVSSSGCFQPNTLVSSDVVRSRSAKRSQTCRNFHLGHLEL